MATLTRRGCLTVVGWVLPLVQCGGRPTDPSVVRLDLHTVDARQVKYLSLTITLVRIISPVSLRTLVPEEYRATLRVG